MAHRAESPVSNQSMAPHAQSALQDPAAFTFSTPCAASSVLCDLPCDSAGSAHLLHFIQHVNTHVMKDPLAGGGSRLERPGDCQQISSS